jgi:TPR repeat protein
MKSALFLVSLRFMGSNVPITFTTAVSMPRSTTRRFRIRDLGGFAGWSLSALQSEVVRSARRGDPVSCFVLGQLLRLAPDRFNFGGRDAIFFYRRAARFGDARSVLLLVTELVNATPVTTLSRAMSFLRYGSSAVRDEGQFWQTLEDLHGAGWIRLKPTTARRIHVVEARYGVQEGFEWFVVHGTEEERQRALDGARRQEELLPWLEAVSVLHRDPRFPDPGAARVEDLVSTLVSSGNFFLAAGVLDHFKMPEAEIMRMLHRGVEAGDRRAMLDFARREKPRTPEGLRLWRRAINAGVPRAAGLYAMDVLSARGEEAKRLLRMAAERGDTEFFPGHACFEKPASARQWLRRCRHMTWAAGCAQMRVMAWQKLGERRKAARVGYVALINGIDGNHWDVTSVIAMGYCAAARALLLARRTGIVELRWRHCWRWRRPDGLPTTEL